MCYKEYVKIILDPWLMNQFLYNFYYLVHRQTNGIDEVQNVIPNPVVWRHNVQVRVVNETLLTIPHLLSLKLETCIIYILQKCCVLFSIILMYEKMY